MFFQRFLSKKFDIIERFDQAFNKEGYDFNVNIARLFVCFFLLWKLLSRNFEFYGYVPAEIFNFYPIDVYRPDKYILWTGLPWITDILTMHWVHWFIDRPGPDTLRFIQHTAMGLLLALAIFGRGPKRILVWCCYISLIYLWGNLILLGQEVDSVMLYFGMLIVLGLANYDDRPIWQLKRSFNQEKNQPAGRAISGFYLILVSYYFASGLRKFTDITFPEWFKYDLIETIQMQGIRADFTSTYTPEVFKYLYQFGEAGILLPTLVYLSHLLVPTVFFQRNKVFYFFIFYAVFHFMTFGVSISFTGYIVVWACLFHHKEWSMKLFCKDKLSCQ